MLWWHKHIGQQWLTTDCHRDLHRSSVPVWSSPCYGTTRAFNYMPKHMRGSLFRTAFKCQRLHQNPEKTQFSKQTAFPDLPSQFPHTQTFLSWGSLAIHCSVSALLYDKHFFFWAVLLYWFFPYSSTCRMPHKWKIRQTGLAYLFKLKMSDV